MYVCLMALLASVTGEALRVVRVSQCCDDSAFHIFTTRLAFGAKLNVVVTTAVVVIILHEVAPRGQQTPTH